MTTSILRATIAATTVLGVALITFHIVGLLTEDHDAWDIFAPVQVAADPVTVRPDDLISSKNQETLRKIVKETRGFGVPWSIYVTTDEAENRDTPPDTWPEAIYDETPIETSPDARDGLLLAVVVPTDDHTATHAEFVAGENFFPEEGITPERLQEIVDVQMAPLIEDNRISAAVIEGATWLEWTPLFQPTPDQPPTELQSGLSDLLHPLVTAAIAGLAMLVLVAAAVITWLTRRGRTATVVGKLNAITAAAASIGRVDAPVLRAIRGNDGEVGAMAADIPAETAIPDAGADHTELEPPSPSAYTQSHRSHGYETMTTRPEIEDDLASRGVYHPKSVVYTWWLSIISGSGLVIGLMGLVLSVLGETVPTLSASIALTAVSLVTLIWNASRSWTTNAGRRALHEWNHDHKPSQDDDWLLFDSIVNTDTYRVPTTRIDSPAT